VSGELKCTRFVLKTLVLHCAITRRLVGGKKESATGGLKPRELGNQQLGENGRLPEVWTDSGVGEKKKEDTP